MFSKNSFYLFNSFRNVTQWNDRTHYHLESRNRTVSCTDRIPPADFSKQITAILPAHAPVVGARYPIGEARLRSLWTPCAHLDPHAAIRLSLQVHCYLLLVSRTSDHSAYSVGGGHPHTFIL